MICSTRRVGIGGVVPSRASMAAKPTACQEQDCSDQACLSAGMAGGDGHRGLEVC